MLPNILAIPPSGSGVKSWCSKLNYPPAVRSPRASSRGAVFVRLGPKLAPFSVPKRSPEPHRWGQALGLIHDFTGDFAKTAEPALGIEPRTYALRKRRSTTELCRPSRGPSP